MQDLAKIGLDSLIGGDVQNIKRKQRSHEEETLLFAKENTDTWRTGFLHNKRLFPSKAV